MSTESVGSSASFLQPRRLFQDELEQNAHIAPGAMTTPLSSPRDQDGHFRNRVSDTIHPSSAAVSLPSDRAVMATGSTQNAPGMANSPLSSLGQFGYFNTDNRSCQPTMVRTSENTPEAVKAPYYSPNGYNGNRCLTSGLGGSGQSDRHAMLTTNGQDVPKIECPCGSGTCVVKTSHTAKNPNRRFYSCPANVIVHFTPYVIFIYFTC